jgi:glycogen operon protein
MDGGPLQNPPLLETLAHDPVLRDCKLVAEAWDAGGLYQVGAFPAYRRWSEWNGRFRDDVRRFLKGDDGTTGALATRLVGSPDLYAERGPVASVNFVTCHDGFSLADLVSYNEKHNEANGEDNRDGNDANESWNCGVEGPTDDPAVLALRGRQMRNALVAVLVSQGVPMLLSGDEVGRSQGGNNNGYCHDDELTWFDWSLVEANADLLAFTRDLIALRHAEPVLREERFPDGTDLAGSGYPDVSWHGVTAWAPDWSPGNRVLAVLRSAQHLPGPTALLYTAFNSHWEQHDVELPGLPDGLAWYRAVDTARGPGDDSRPPGAAERLEHQDRYPLGPRSSVVLLARAPAATGAIAVDPPEGT